MTEKNPALYLQQRTDHTAEGDRALLTSFVSNEGVSGSGDLKVTQNGTPGMSVYVAAGKAFVQGDDNGSQGLYHVWNDATVTLAISAADATNPRRDLIVARVRDAYYSGATNAFDLFVITGTPAASPSDPAVPNNCLVLARVAVAALATSITNANITDLRTQYTPAASSWTKPWNTAWGAIARVKSTTGQIGIGAGPTDLTGYSATITTVAGRLYRISARMQCVESVNTTAHYYTIYRGATDIGRFGLSEGGTTTNRVTLSGFVTDDAFTPGSTTYKITANRYAGAGTLDIENGSGANGYFLIEDIGPA